MLCNEAREHLSAYVDRELTAELSAAIRDHLAGCAECRALVADLRATADLLSRLPVRPAPRHVAADVQREIERRLILEAPAAVPAQAPERTLPLHRARQWPRALAMAATLVLALGIGILAYLGQQPPVAVTGHRTGPAPEPAAPEARQKLGDATSSALATAEPAAPLPPARTAPAGPITSLEDKIRSGHEGDEVASLGSSRTFAEKPAGPAGAGPTNDAKRGPPRFADEADGDAAADLDLVDNLKGKQGIPDATGRYTYGNHVVHDDGLRLAGADDGLWGLQQAQGGYAKMGGGYLLNGTFSNSNNWASSYNGGIVVANGTLQLGAANVIPPGQSLALNTEDLYGINGRILDLNGDVTALKDGRGLSLDKSGSGTLTLTGANTYGGGTQITAGTLYALKKGIAATLTDMKVAARDNTHGQSMKYENGSDALTLSNTTGSTLALNSLDQTVAGLARGETLDRQGGAISSGGTLDLGKKFDTAAGGRKSGEGEAEALGSKLAMGGGGLEKSPLAPAAEERKDRRDLGEKTSIGTGTITLGLGSTYTGTISSGLGGSGGVTKTSDGKVTLDAGSGVSAPGSVTLSGGVLAAGGTISGAGGIVTESVPSPAIVGEAAVAWQGKSGEGRAGQPEVRLSAPSAAAKPAAPAVLAPTEVADSTALSHFKSDSVAPKAPATEADRRTRTAEDRRAELIREAIKASVSKETGGKDLGSLADYNLVLRAASTAEGTSALSRLFAANGWQPVSINEATGAAADAAAEYYPKNGPAQKGGQSAGSYVLVSRDATGTTLVVATDRDSLSRFVSQVAQSSTVTVGPGSSPAFTAVAEAQAVLQAQAELVREQLATNLGGTEGRGRGGTSGGGGGGGSRGVVARPSPAPAATPAPPPTVTPSPKVEGVRAPAEAPTTTKPEAALPAKAGGGPGNSTEQIERDKAQEKALLDAFFAQTEMIQHTAVGNDQVLLVIHILAGPAETREGKAADVSAPAVKSATEKK